MNKSKISIILLIIILINHISTRFIFFNLHGMKDFVDTMSLLSTALTCIFLLSNNIVTSFAASIGNIVGFIVGYIFKKETIDIITGNTNNMWLIWLITYILIVVVTMFVSRETSKK